MARFTQFAVIAAREALKDSGFDREQADLDRCGVIVSSGIGGLQITEDEHDRGREKGFDRVSPFYIPMKKARRRIFRRRALPAERLLEMPGRYRAALIFAAI